MRAVRCAGAVAVARGCPTPAGDGAAFVPLCPALPTRSLLLWWIACYNRTMRRALISSESPLWAKAFGALLFVFVVPIFLVVKLIILPFEKPIQRSPQQVAKYLRDFLEGTGGDWDWDDFVSIEIADPRLEDIRERAAALELPMPDTDTAPLKALVAEAEALAAQDG
jgi:hypothetical protein